VLGDNGTLTFTGGATSYLQQAASTDTGLGGDDVITAGGGSNVLIGGAGSDSIIAGNGSNTVLGDSGQIDYSAAGVPASVVSTGLGDGGNDSITLGNGTNIVIGGSGSDTATAGSGTSILLGDTGSVLFGVGGVPSNVASTGLGGGDDTLAAGYGTNVIVGGAGNDILGGGGGTAYVIGDNGTFNYYPVTGIVAAMQTTDATGADIITTDDGNSYVLGGQGSDAIAAGNGDSVLIGDDGQILFNPDGSVIRATTLRFGSGGNDSLSVGSGRSILIGGAGSDKLSAGFGSNILIGDNGQIIWFDGNGKVITSLKQKVGGNDTLLVAGGRNVLIGGTGKNTYGGNSASDLMIRGGRVVMRGSMVQSVQTRGPQPFTLFDLLQRESSLADDGQLLAATKNQDASSVATSPDESLQVPAEQRWIAPEIRGRYANVLCFDALSEFFVPIDAADDGAAEDPGLEEGAWLPVTPAGRVASAEAVAGMSAGGGGDGSAGASDYDAADTLGALAAGFAGWSVNLSQVHGRRSAIDAEALSKLESKEKNRRFKKWLN